MFASHYHADHSTQTFLPRIPSPLSPISANSQIHGRYSSPSSYMSDASSEKTRPQTRGKQGWSKRAANLKKAPSSLSKSDELKERRRRMFLQKVRDGREEGRWERRGEDIMRLDFMQRQRAWEAEQEREASSLPFDPAEEEGEEREAFVLPMSSNAMQISAPASQLRPEEEVDEVLLREEEEMEALLSLMAKEEVEGETSSQQLWSDIDDDYDALFSEVMEHDEDRQQQLYSAGVVREDGSEAMDVS
ncbi:hypothetical protein BAUCODRAFT_147761 [Baudoinia panamericana UAMH 10762]|uniref:Uncharacterized protein n=1 Tax=Baudoinia panamericana (strain UAMH 10762) TaxID=717646 RepID=M2NFF1_BAUPA|nr:uncharacterized protein BAUCODRAFT_147761 [Baudoinia panamericana UAMH 10762]EMC97720.1 hypothetical protein BAUCODRAFT_147761 [Baudoinia panamericana UAMH 10762]